jgi:integrase/recombinase XerC
MAPPIQQETAVASDIVQRFLSYLKTLKGASPHTIRNYEHDLTLFFHHVKTPYPDRKDIRSFVASEREKGISKRTVARRLASLRSFFRYCIKEGIISENPADHIENPKIEKKIPLSIAYEQVEYFFSLPNTETILGLRDKAIMELFYSSGLRLSELAGLRISDLDKAELLLLVRGKGKKERIIPITENAACWIERYLSKRPPTPSDALFLNRFGGNLSPRSIDRMFVSYLKKSGLAETITPHIIRHSIATHWLEQGMDVKTIQLLLGHASMATTTIYAEVSSDLKKKTVQKFHPRA